MPQRKLQIGDKVTFRRNGEISEGYFVVVDIDENARAVFFDRDLPSGIHEGDDMIVLTSD